MYDIDSLIEGAQGFLRERQSSQSTITHHVYSWRRLRRWLEDEGVCGFDHDVECRYFEAAGLVGDDLAKHKREERAHVERLLSVKETGSPPQRIAPRKYIAPKGFSFVCDSYETELANRGLKTSTIKGQLSAVRHFCLTCGARSPEQINASSVTRFTEAIIGCAAQTKSQKLYAIRDFLRFLAAHGNCDAAMASAIPRIPGHKHSSTPSAYTVGELSLLLSGPSSRRCPKRGRAIMLLAGLLGMRVSDIKGLTLGDIDWREKKLSFTQQKTQIRQILPMPDEVWLSLADYLKNERPKIESDRVFLTACAPYHPIDSSHVFHRGVTRAFSSAGIDTAGKHHGMHSLRHSAATNMLSGGTPYPIISAVLGHSSTNVTRRYLSIDVESLRDIALEVPRWRG